MSRPTRAYLWMVPFLMLVGLAVVVLHQPLADAFQSNPVFNGIILLVFVIGIAISFSQVGMLSSEVAWINQFRGHKKWFSRRAPETPRLLAPLAKMLGQHDRELLSLSPPSLRSLLDSVRLRLDEYRDVSRYTIGLLIFLGLLGTFWGLLVTVSAVGEMIGNLSGNPADGAAMFGSLMEGLEGPLSGMGTAFSSSLFGLAGSLILGFLDLQAGHAQNRFFNELEDWLSGVTRLSSGIQISEQGLSTPAYIHAMLEQTAETLDKLQRSVSRDDSQRRLVTDQIQSLAKELATFTDLIRDEQRVLARLVEGQGDLGPTLAKLAQSRDTHESSVQDHVRSLDLSLKRLVDEVVAGRENLVDELRDELRLMSRALAAAESNRAAETKSTKSKASGAIQ